MSSKISFKTSSIVAHTPLGDLFHTEESHTKDGESPSHIYLFVTSPQRDNTDPIYRHKAKSSIMTASILSSMDKFLSQNSGWGLQVG